MRIISKVVTLSFAAAAAWTTASFAQGWYWQNPSPIGNPVSIVVAFDPQTAIAIGSDGIVRTSDGGASWTLLTGMTDHIYAVSFVDANIGTGVGLFGTILRTTDGGASWTRQDSGTTLALLGVSFVDANTGTAVGGSCTEGIILRTTDGGTS
jgi:photosystem II stability/assembly factor-like uncharacterized protein